MSRGILSMRLVLFVLGIFSIPLPLISVSRQARLPGAKDDGGPARTRTGNQGIMRARWGPGESGLDGARTGVISALRGFRFWLDKAQKGRFWLRSWHKYGTKNRGLSLLLLPPLLPEFKSLSLREYSDLVIFQDDHPVPMTNSIECLQKR